MHPGQWQLQLTPDMGMLVLAVLYHMQGVGFEPNKCTFASALPVCLFECS